MSKINGELVTLNVVNSFLLAFRWGLVTVVVTVMVGVGLRTWRELSHKRTVQLEFPTNQNHHALSADEALLRQSQNEYEDTEAK